MDIFSSGYTTENEIREDPEPEFIPLDEAGGNVNLYNQVEGIFAEHDAHAYENLQEQLIQMNQSNWELMLRCRDIETERRIAKRSIPTWIKDRVIHWKKKVKRVKQKAKAWIIRKCSSSAEVPSVSRFRDTLHDRYYPQDMSFPDDDEF